MPYIPQYRREELALAKGFSEYSGPGDLNYVLTGVCNEYLVARGLSYRTINDILGALEGAKLEFYRRIAVAYEDRKKEENGDVYI